MVDRTTRESIAASELVMASGKLTDRKSDASCRRRMRNGRTISRVEWRRWPVAVESPLLANSGLRKLRVPLRRMDNAPRDSCGEAYPRRSAKAPCIGGGVIVKNRVQRIHRRLARPRMLACQHLVENDPECEQVTPLIDFLPEDLLRRHIGDGSHDLPGTLSFAVAVLRSGSIRSAIRFARPKSNTFT